jgi:ABC-type transporter Mla maintaining outer membrane lipid asymmetry permease subunit MlaE
MNPAKLLYHVGRFWLLLRQVFRKPDKSRICWDRGVSFEVNAIGIGPLGIVSIILGIPLGAVIAIQSAFRIRAKSVDPALCCWSCCARFNYSANLRLLIVQSHSRRKRCSSIASEIGDTARK